MRGVVEMVWRPREEIGMNTRAEEFEGISEVGRRAVRGDDEEIPGNGEKGNNIAGKAV